MFQLLGGTPCFVLGQIGFFIATRKFFTGGKVFASYPWHGLAIALLTKSVRRMMCVLRVQCVLIIIQYYGHHVYIYNDL